MKVRSTFADILIYVGQAGLMNERTFVSSAVKYAERIEEYISDAPQMIVKCIELVNWMLNDTSLVLECIDEMYKATLHPREPQYACPNLKNQVGKAILEFCENTPNDSERGDLINCLKDGTQFNLKSYFEFENRDAA